MSAVIGADELTVLEDEITDELIEAYVQGVRDARRQLDLDEAFDIDLYDLDRALNLVIAGKTYLERIRDGSDIEVLTDTEWHRMYNTGVYDAARNSGISGLMKTWVTMGDERVRDTHEYIDHMTIPFEAYFYTFDGDYARFPGDFQLPQNSINCRCVMTVSRA